MTVNVGSSIVTGFHVNEYGNALLTVENTGKIHPHHNASVIIDGMPLTLLEHDNTTFTVIVPEHHVDAGYTWEVGDRVNVQHDPPLY